MAKQRKKNDKKIIKATLLTTRYLAGGATIALISSICFASIFFAKLNNHKQDLQEIFQFETGLNIDYSNLQTGFTWYGQPFINLDNLVIFDDKNNKLIKVKNLNLTLSYASLWHLQPVFSNISLNNSDLKFELDHNNNILLNQYPLFNLDEKKKIEFEFSKWLVLQKNISIDKVNFEFLDSKHNILPIDIYNIKLAFNHDGGFDNNLSVSARLRKSRINADIKFNGKEFNYKTWTNGLISVHNIGNKGYLVDINSEIQGGSIEYIKGTLDSNKNIFTSYSNSYGNVENFYGTFALNRTDSHKFQLSASNLTLNTEYGYLFHDATIDGNIDTQNGGFLKINNLSLNGINSIIKYFVKEQGLEFSGDINTVNLKWFGDIKYPSNISLTTNFSNIALKSHIATVPSFNNLSGSINTQKDHGNIALYLNNSTINAPNLLRNQVLISQLSTAINWQLESSNKVRLNWTNSLIKTPDITMTTYGQYNFAESHLTTTINLQKINLANIYKYAPAKTDKLVVNDLKENFKGTLNNTTVTIDGVPRLIPFKNGGGKLTVTGHINNASYKYLNGWPIMHDVNGKLTGLNQKITFTTTSGSIGNLPANKGSIVIPDIVAKSPQAIATGEMTNNTSDYIDFLLNTPLKDQISTPNNTFNIDGTASSQITLTVPLNNPDRLNMKGTFNLNSNKVTLKSNESITVNNMSGTVNFNQNGITTGKLSANGYDSDLDITIPNQHNIEAEFPNLNYTKIIDLINPKLESIVTGFAATNIKYNIDNEQLTLNSNLESVVINAPRPLNKAESTVAPLVITANLKNDANQVNLNYNNLLFGKLQYNSQLELESAKISLGAYDMADESDVSEPKITLKTRLNNTYIQDWLPFVRNMAHIFTPENESSAPSINKQSSNESAENESSTSSGSMFPILVDWSSNSFWFKHYNLGNGNAKLYIYPSFVQGQITSPNVDGKVAYVVNENHIDVNLTRLNLSRNNIYKESTPILAELNLPTSPAESQILIESYTNESMAQITNINESALLIAKTLPTESNVIEKDAYNDETSKVTIPSIDFYVKDLYLDDFYWGALTGTVIQQHDDLFFNNITLRNNAAFSRINMITHCMSCTRPEDQYVAFNIHSDVNNFGNLMLKADQGDMFRNGNGYIDISAMWPGSIADFDFNNIEAYANLNMNDGVVVKIKPGLFGALMGVINFSAINITNINHINFNSFFGQSFAYKNMKTNLYLKNSDLHIDQLELSGDVADIRSFGNYYIESGMLDSYLTVQPKIAGTIATTAGIVTLNPIIGAFIYLAQKLVGDPINKAFAISYHVTGPVNNPDLKQTTISKQIIRNFKSSMNLLNDDGE